jgi:hypothetical protein
MSFWMVAAITGCIAMLGGLFALLIFRLDAEIEEELRLTDEDRHWISII